MIALNIDKPTSCLSCPCLQTITATGSEDNRKYAVRFCHAAHKEICVYEDSEELPKNWYEFNIPTWCPWLEI